VCEGSFAAVARGLCERPLEDYLGSMFSAIVLDMRLGIDFGTTRTVIAGVDDGRYPVASFDVRGEYRDYLPGIVALRDDQLVFDAEARDVLLTGRGSALPSIKRAITGLTPEDPIPGLPGFSALEALTQYLRWVRSMLLERSNFDLDGSTPLTAMVAVPANAGTRQRFLTLEAFRQAGFEVLGLVGEPTAAAIEFAFRNASAMSNRSPKRYVVVYDLGGGTFDTAAVSLTERRFQLLCARGISRLGGADFDRIIADLALRGTGLGLEELESAKQAAILEACREAKEGLRPASRRLLVDLGPVDARLAPVLLDTPELYAACEPLIERTLTMVDELFRALVGRGVDPEDPRQLGALYLVGGSSAFPALNRVLRARFKRKIQLAPQPHAATCVGLAIAADSDAQVFVREAVTRHFGVWREADGGRDKVFDSIISRDTEPPSDEPLVVERHYRPAHPIGHLRFLECTDLDEHGQPSGDLTPWEEIRFPYDPSLFARESLDALPILRQDTPLGEDIVEVYTHDSDGTIAVAIENRTRGYRRHYRLGALR